MRKNDGRKVEELDGAGPMSLITRSKVYLWEWIAIVR